MSAVLDYLPRGNTLSDEAWRKRHLLLQWLLLLHVPALFIFGVARGYAPLDVAGTLAVPFACLVLGRILRTRRLASFFVTAGLVYCSAALVGLSGGSIEAHFHFFIMIGFIALYQDWVPFLWNIVFTVLSHGFGSVFRSDLIFNHHAGIAHPWTWSLLHGVAVLAACVGVVLFWKQTEDEQNKTIALRSELAATELRQRRFVADLLVNLARRNQNLLYRQLDLLNQLEENERDPDALAQLFRLDHLATRIRRNAENLLVLSGEEPPRKWGRSVPLVDVVRAGIAETEDLDRVDFAVDEGLAIAGRAVADTTHLLAELIENAVHFSPPGVGVMLRTRPYLPIAGAQVLTIEDWGVGMSSEELAEANHTLATPGEVDLSLSQRLGLNVVARLSRRYGIAVSLTSTPGGGVTAVVLLPPDLFDARELEPLRVAPLRRTPAPVLSPSTAAPTLQTTMLAPPPPGRHVFPSQNAMPPGAMPFTPIEPAPVVAPLPPTPAPLPIRTAQPFDVPSETSSNGWNSWWTPHVPPGNGRGNGSGDFNGTSASGTGANGGARHSKPPSAPAERATPPNAQAPTGAAPRGITGSTAGQPGAGPMGPPASGTGPTAAKAGAAGPGAGGQTPAGGGTATWPGSTQRAAGPTAAGPTAAGPTAAGPTAAGPTAARPGTRPGAGPTAAGAGAAGQGTRSQSSGTRPTAAGPGSAQRSAAAASAAGVTTAGPGTAGPGAAATTAGGGAGGATAAGATATTAGPTAEQPLGSTDSVAAEHGSSGDTPRLSQRVPQAHLADALRRPAGPVPDPQPLRDPKQAREALSRFQASQRAARAVLDEQPNSGDDRQNGSTGPEDRRR